MRLWKVLIAVSLSVCSLAAAAVGSAARPPMQNGTFSVRDGRAGIQLKMKGSIIGRLGKGRLVVTNSPDAGATIVVRGAAPRYLDARTTAYSGANIRFRIADDSRFTVKLSGKGMNFSAVGRGDGWMDGWGDPGSGIYFDGSYSLNGTDYPTLPNDRTRFELAAPPPAG